MRVKSRFIYVHKEVNVGKLDSLTSLYGVCRTYLQTCIDLLLEKRCTKMPRGQFLRFFPGQKRFAYKGLLRALESKSSILKVNPAYTSQGCPSCGYVSRKNRVGVKFECRGCGRKSHADVVGAKGILGRSEDKSISCDTEASEVKGIVRRRYAARRRSPAFSLSKESLQDGLESRAEVCYSVLGSNSSQ